MTLTESDLSELLAAVQAGDMTDTIRTSLAWVLQQLIEAELSSTIGAAPHERTEARTAQRNGHRPKLVTTTAGDIELQIPKLRTGSFFPSLLERRRRIDRALFAVVMEAWVHGVSTRKVDDLVKALGAASGISKSEVSRICAELDRDLETFRTRRLEGEFPYVFCDATYVKARVKGRVVSRAVVVATGVTRTGDREVLGVEVGDSEDGAFWTSFLRGLRARGLTGVQLVISDHHLGLKAAIAGVFIGSSWQRCRVHFMRNVLARVPKAAVRLVSAFPVRTHRPQRAAVRSPNRASEAPLHVLAEPVVPGELGGLGSPGRRSACLRGRRLVLEPEGPRRGVAAQLPRDRRRRTTDRTGDGAHARALRSEQGDVLALGERQIPTRHRRRQTRVHAASVTEPPERNGG